MNSKIANWCLSPLGSTRAESRRNYRTVWRTLSELHVPFFPQLPVADRTKARLQPDAESAHLAETSKAHQSPARAMRTVPLFGRKFHHALSGLKEVHSGCGWNCSQKKIARYSARRAAKIQSLFFTPSSWNVARSFVCDRDHTPRLWKLQFGTDVAPLERPSHEGSSFPTRCLPRLVSDCQSLRRNKRLIRAPVRFQVTRSEMEDRIRCRSN